MGRQPRQGNEATSQGCPLKSKPPISGGFLLVRLALTTEMAVAIVCPELTFRPPLALAVSERGHALRPAMSVITRQRG